MIDLKLNRMELEKTFSINVDSMKVNDVADIIRDDIKRNLMESTTLDGGTPAPLNRKYRSFKLRKYGHDNIFWGKTGKLRESVKVSYGTNKATISIGNGRTKIAGWLDGGTSKMRARNFFGISKRALTKIDFWLNNFYKKIA